MWCRLALMCAAAVVAAACSSTSVDDGATCARAPWLELGLLEQHADRQEVDIRFQSGCDFLAGTLYLPTSPGPYPAVVFVHGSGEAHRLGFGGPWITTPLVDAGIAVLTYDKRGVGDSEGSCCPGDDGDFDPLADDVSRAVTALRFVDGIDTTRIGLLGISQAGWVIPIVVERAPDVSFTVIFSGSAVSLGEELLYSRLTGEDEATPPETPMPEIEARLAAEGPSGFDPRPFLRRYRVPGLWIYGALDQSQPTSVDVEILQRIATEENRDLTVTVFDDLGHDTTHDPRTIDAMLRWLSDRLAG